MHKGQTVLLACRLTQGGFSGERVFRINLVDGSEHVGVAPVDYCTRPDHAPLGTGEPAKGERIDGLVEGRIVDNNGPTARVATPDGEVIRVGGDRVLYALEPKMNYVPFGS